MGSDEKKPPPGIARREKAKAAHQGKDVFSTNSLDPKAHQELIDLKAQLASETAPVSGRRKSSFAWKSFVKLFR